MSLVINTNVSSSRAQRTLSSNQSSLSRTFERLSSGMRINGASDDAAGLSIGTRMEAQVRGLSKAVGNANDAISLSQTADGAMNEVTQILQRIRELTVQAASETNTSGDRAKIQAEIDQLVKEVDGIGRAQFNGQDLFGGQFDFQLGADTESGSSVGIKTKVLASNRLGAHSRHTSGAVDTTATLTTNDLTVVTRDGSSVAVRASAAGDDTVSTANNAGSAIAKAAAINSGTENHGITAYAGATTVTSTGISASQVLDQDDVLTINGEKITGFTVSQNDADGSLVDAINAVSEKTGVVASLNGSGNLQLVAEDGRNIAIGATNNAANLGFTDGTVQGGTLTLESRDTYTMKFASNAVKTAAMGNIGATAGGGDPLNGVNVRDVGFVDVDKSYSTPVAGDTITLNSASGTFVENGASDYTGATFFLSFIGDSGTFLWQADPNNDAIRGGLRGVDITAPRDPNTAGSATFTLNGSSFTLNYTLGPDLDNTNLPDTGLAGGHTHALRFTLEDGVLGATPGDLDTVMGQNYATTAVSSVDVTTTTAAERSLNIIDMALEEVNATRAELGALTNRLESTVNNLSQTKNNIADAKSRIMDADFAAETAQLSKSQIIQQASVSVLAQANAAPQVALSLI